MPYTAPHQVQKGYRNMHGAVVDSTADYCRHRVQVEDGTDGIGAGGIAAVVIGVLVIVGVIGIAVFAIGRNAEEGSSRSGGCASSGATSTPVGAVARHRMVASATAPRPATSSTGPGFCCTACALATARAVRIHTSPQGRAPRETGVLHWPCPGCGRPRGCRRWVAPRGDDACRQRRAPLRRRQARQAGHE